ncbi:unnamed protein product [Clavelina lepadiformis]|uniref:Uncharacterized protein n=1 Tax=Clavelina lepadiformis TaxID=159417 RepID=A0ABP0F4X5_CLALP
MVLLLAKPSFASRFWSSDPLLQDPTGHQICSSLPGTYITVDVCIFKQTDQTIWLDTSDVPD